MKIGSFALALAALITGLLAAWKWYKASGVEIIPVWQQMGVIERPGGDPEGWVVGIMQAAQESSSLNQTAALWTAVSVALSGLSAVFSSWP